MDSDRVNHNSDIILIKTVVADKKSTCYHHGEYYVLSRDRARIRP